MAHPPPSTTPTDIMAWERRTWVDSVTSLSNFREQVPGDIPSPDNQQPAPSTYMTLMYNGHYTLSTTHYHAPTDTWLVHGNNSLLPADYTPPPHPHHPGRDTYTREDEPGDPHICGTWGRRLPETLLSIRSRNQSWQGDSTDLADPRRAVDVEGHPASQAEGGPPEPHGIRPPTPDHHTALRIHGGSPPHDPAMAGPRHPHPKLRPPHGSGHARHPAMLLRHPETPPAGTPTRPGAEEAPLPDDPPARAAEATPQRHHAPHMTPPTTPAPARTQDPGKTRTHTRCPNSRPCPHCPQDPASSARPRCPGPPATPHVRLLRVRLHDLHHHNHLIHLHHQILVHHTTPPAAGKITQTGPRTRPHRRRPRHRQGTRSLTTRYRASGAAAHPSEARARSPAETKEYRQVATQTCRRTAAPVRCRTKAQAQARRRDNSANPAPRGSPLRPPAPAIVNSAAAAPSMAPTHRERRRRHHLHVGTRRGRGARHLVPPPLKTRTPDPRTTPDETGTTPGPKNSVPAPLQAPVSAHIQQMPCYCRPRGSQTNPEAESLSGCPQVQLHSRPCSQCTPTAQDYEESPGHATATSPHDPTTHTHAHSHTPAQGHGPSDRRGSAGPTGSCGSCGTGPGQSPPWRAWSASPAGSRRRTADSGRRGDRCRRLHGKPCCTMRSIPRESTPGSSPQPITIRMSSGACGRPSRRHGKEGAFGTSPQAPPPVHRHQLATLQASTHGHRQQRHGPNLQHLGNAARHTA